LRRCTPAAAIPTADFIHWVMRITGLAQLNGSSSHGARARSRRLRLRECSESSRCNRTDSRITRCWVRISRAASNVSRSCRTVSQKERRTSRSFTGGRRSACGSNTLSFMTQNPTEIGKLSMADCRWPAKNHLALFGARRVGRNCSQLRAFRGIKLAVCTLLQGGDRLPCLAGP